MKQVICELCSLTVGAASGLTRVCQQNSCCSNYGLISRRCIAKRKHTYTCVCITLFRYITLHYKAKAMSPKHKFNPSRHVLPRHFSIRDITIFFLKSFPKITRIPHRGNVIVENNQWNFFFFEKPISASVVSG